MSKVCEMHARTTWGVHLSLYLEIVTSKRATGQIQLVMMNSANSSTTWPTKPFR